MLTPGFFAAPHAVTGAPLAPPFAAPWLTFNSAFSHTTGSPIAIATGDFDGDRKPDVVVAQARAVGGFAFLRNEAEGRLGQPVSYPGSGSASGIVAADFDGDGKLDVAVTDGDALTTGNTVSVFMGNGDGTFGARQPVSIGSGNVVPVGIVAADFDNDGDKDLAVAAFGYNGSGSSVLLLSNNGDGTFAAPVAFVAGEAPYGLAAGDLNGDGRPDLAVGHRDYRVTVLLNNATGSFALAAGYGNLTSGTNWAGPQFPCVAVGDVNGDGRLDVLYGNTRTWNGSTGLVVQLRNTGTGTLTRAADIPMVSYTAGPTDLVTADMNGDGALDILAASYDQRATDGVCVMLNNGSGAFGPAVLYPGGQSTLRVAAADMNGDGKPDILTADDYSRAVTVRFNPGNGTFPVVPFDYAGSKQFFQDAADLDGDGDIDIFTSGPHPSYDGGAIMRNNGAGRFTRTYIGNGMDGVAGGVLRDLNGDGKPDLLFNNANTSSRYDFFTALNDGSGNFGPPTRWLVGSAGWGGIDAFDIDNDGDLDVIDCEALGASGGPAGRFFIALNNGNGTFQQPYAHNLPRRPTAVVGGDFNEDGKVDLAFADEGAYGFDTSVFIVLGNGNGTFQPPTVYTVARGPSYIVKADFDGDGHVDLATLSRGYNDGGGFNVGPKALTLLFGTGNGTFNGITTYYAPFSPDLAGASGMTVGDVNGDGSIDILTTGSSNDVALYLNNGVGVFSFPYRIGAAIGAHAVLYRDFTGDGIADLAVLNSPPAAGFDGGVAIVPGIPTAPVAEAVVSRKLHNGAAFDVALPLTGTPAIESRRGGGPNFDRHQIVVTFNTPVTVESVSVTGNATATRAVNGNVVTVDLANVADARTITVTLNNVSNNSTSVNVAVPASFLLGDTNADGFVNSGDALQTRARSGQATDASNFRSDINVDGAVNGSDALIVRSQAGASIGAAPTGAYSNVELSD